MKDLKSIMKKGKKSLTSDLISSGVALGIGSSVVDSMPANSAKVGVQSGISTAASYYPTMVNIHMGGKIIKSVRKLGKK